jgi:hypothetical protein
MIKFILIPGLVMLSCGSTRSNQTTAKNDPAIVLAPIEKAQTDSLKAQATAYAALPTCLKNKIDSFKLKEKHERPQSVVEYMYKGKKVYYVVMPCCDFFNEVYDENCGYLGAPDGGFTGKGDGKLPDFTAEAKPGKEIWNSVKVN